MTDGTFQPDAKSQELLAAGVAPSAVETFQTDRAATANIEAERALKDQGFSILSPEEQELANQGFSVPPKAEFREVLTPAQRQSVTQVMVERNAAQRAATTALPPGFKEVDPLDVYTDDELLKQPDFNPEDYFRKHQVAVESDPKKFARFTELYRQAKQRGMGWGALGKGALKTAGEILASPYGLLTYAAKAAGGESGPATAGESIPRMLTNLGRTVVTGLQAGPGAVVGDIVGSLADETYRGASEASQRPATEALAGTVADTAGLLTGLQGAGEKALRVLHLSKPWDKMSTQEVQEHLRAKAAQKDALEELSRGEVVRLEPTTTELAAAGTPVRPEEVARHREGGPISWLGYGKMFEGIHAGAAGAKRWVNNTAAGKLAGDLGAARGGFEATAREARGVATAENAAKLRAAEQELAAAEQAVKASPTAQAIDAVTRAKAALSALSQRAAAGTIGAAVKSPGFAVEKLGQALQLPEKVAGYPGVSALGTVAGMFFGGAPGALKAIGGRLAAMAAATVGRGIERFGEKLAPRSITLDRAADMAKAFNDSVGKALGPGGLGMDVAFTAALTPEGETPEEVGAFMGTMRLFKGLPVAMRRVVGGELVSRRSVTGTVSADPAYGQNRVLDAAHSEAMKLAGQDVQDRVNFVRALARKLGGQLYFLDPATAPEVFVEASRQAGAPMTLEQAQQIARQEAMFSMNLRDQDGNPQKIIFAFGERGIGHDMGHLMQAVFPESVNRSLDALIAKSYTPQELESFAQDYVFRLSRNPDGSRLTPEQLQDGGWKKFLEPPPWIESPEQYILRELGAENVSKSFDSRAQAMSEKPDLYRQIAFGVAGLASSLGVNLLGETPLGAAVQPKVMKEQEIALSDILKSPTRQAVVEVEARRAGVKPPKAPGTPTPKQERGIERAIEQASDTPPPADAVVPAAEAQNARQITEIIADVIRKGGGMLKAWYRTAPGATDAALSSAAPVSEVKARKAAIEAARVIPEAERPLWERLFFAYGMSPSSRGPQVKTWNPMVFAANAVRWAKALSAAGAAAESPYPIVNGELTPDGWRQLRNDLQVASRNYLAGYAASGVEPGAAVKAEDFKKMVEGAGYRVPEKTTPSPEQLPQDRADVINYLLAPDVFPKTGRVAAGPQIPMNVIGQKFSEATIPGRVSPIPGAPVYTGEAAQAKGVEGVSVKETNPFRAKMRQLGVRPELFSVLQMLNVEHLAKVELAPEQPVLASNILTAAGGFMPRTELIGGQFSPESARDDVPRIRAAGLRDKTTGKLYAGFMHTMAFDRVFDELGPIEGVKGLEDAANPNFSKIIDRFEQGFLVQDPGKEGFRFVDRTEGAKIGEKSGQLRRAVKGGELHSEDVSWGQASPVADAVRDLATMTPGEFERGPRGFRGRFGGGASAWAAEQGASAKDQSDASAMRSTYEALRMAANEAMAAKDSALAIEYITRAQTAREAYEVATGEMIDGKPGLPGALREVRKYEPDFQAPLGETVRPSAKPAEASLAIEAAREPAKAKMLPEGQAMPATSSFGRRLEEEGFEFRVTGQRGVRTVEVWKDGEPVGELQSSQTKNTTTAYVGNIKTVEKSSTGEEMRKRGIAESMYRELANVLQEDGVTQIEGMAVHPSIPGLRERVFGKSQIETGEGVGISPKETADYIEEKRKTPAEAFYAEIKNAIRPKAEGQYTPTSEKGKELEKEGFDFVTSSRGRDRYVKVNKDGELVGEIIVTLSDRDKTRATVSAVDVEKDFQGRGLGEALYREVANTLQDDGIRLLGGMVVAPAPLGIRERVFGDTGVRTAEGEGMSAREAQDMIRSANEARRFTFVDAENFIRPKTEGQYAPRLVEATEDAPSEKGYIYHATNRSNLQDILAAGKLETFLPDYGTEQTAWPDQGKEPRNYWTPKAGAAWAFAPEEGRSVLVRTKQTPFFSREITGDFFATKPVGVGALEVLTSEGWKPLADWTKQPELPGIAGQYAPQEKKEPKGLFAGYNVGKGGYSQGEGMFRDNILDALSTWQTKGTIDQLKKHLEKFSGTRDEARWTGLNQWLDNWKTAGKTVLTKEEVEDFIVENQVRLEELTLTEGERPDWSEGEVAVDWGGTLPYWDFFRGDIGESYGTVSAEARNEKALLEAYDNNTEMPEPDIVYTAYSSNGRRFGGEYKTPEEAQAEVEDLYSPEAESGEVQYGKLTLPGGWNYKEVLVTLPDFPAPPEFAGKLEAKEAFRAEMIAKYGSYQGFGDKGSASERDRWNELREESARPGYVSPHFEDSGYSKNLIAHMRVKTRRTLDDKELYFLEEIQSDLHQEGAKSGYASDMMRAEDRAKILEVENVLRRFSKGKATPEEIAKFDLEGVTSEEALKLAEEAVARWQTERKAAKKAVPDAPFRGANWKKLLMKRAIIAAAEEGADALGWTTGDMQRERYNLAKFIGSITYHKEPDGTYSAEFWRKGQEPGSSGSALIREVSRASVKDIADLAGADVARQMEAGEGTERPYSSTAALLERGKAVEVFAQGEFDWFIRFANGEQAGVWRTKANAEEGLKQNNEIFDSNIENPRRELTPKDLSLGGKGKLNLYDKELVNLANELGEKYGAKVEMKLVLVPGKDAQAVWTLPVTSALRKRARDIGFGQFSPKEEGRKPDEKGFFSAAKRALEDKMPARASAQQVRAILSPNNGVKPEELKWVGLDDFLKEAEETKKTIEKADVLKFVDENEVQINEVWKASKETRQAALPPGTWPVTGPKWQGKKQPGGKYYRELIWAWANPTGRATTRPYRHRIHWGDIKNPLAHARMTDRVVKGARTLFIEELQSDYHQKGRRSGYFSAEEGQALSEKMRDLSEQMNALRLRRNNALHDLDLARVFQPGGLYGSTDAWLRTQGDPKYKDLADKLTEMKIQWRELPDGHPFKSDGWREIQRLEALRNKYIQTESEQGEGGKNLPKPESAEKLTRAEEVLAVAEKEFAQKRAEYFQSENASRNYSNRLSAAPFSKSWREVFFRRLVNYAARMGYDAVSWTTGAQQAATYEQGLRAAVDTIRWEPREPQLESVLSDYAPEGAVQVTASKDGVIKFQHPFNRDGTPIGALQGVEAGTTLLDVVGESLAKKIQTEEKGHIEGEHLAIGAAWMQAVYDVILPEYARKFGKKFGAKVEILPHGAVARVRKAPARPGVPQEHPGLFEPVDILPPRTVKSVHKTSFTAWSMNITPEMRKSVVETGTAQFSPKAGGEFKIEPVKTAWGDFPNAVMHTSIVALQKHPDYGVAKAGDPEAAIRVTRAMIKPDRAAALAANYPGAKLLPVRAEEARGRNALPSALAVVLSSLTGLDIATGIVQASRARHTGASDVERIERRAEFAGPVEEGGKYILLDDVSTSGGTLAALRAFIQRNGGEVVGISVLGAAHRPDRGHGSHVALRDETFAELKKLDSARQSGILQRYGLEKLEDLSNGEARIALREARKAERR